MLVEWMINLGVNIFDVIMSMLGVLPSLPQVGMDAIDFVFNKMYSAVGLVGIFLDMGFVKVMVPIAIAVFNFDHIVKFIMFILKKIPIINIK